MSLKQNVLDYFMSHPDEYVSGEALALKFGKSRAAVWKAVRALQSEGCTITAVSNRGYRFSRDNDILSEEGISRGLDFQCRVMLYQSIDSTNTQAKRLVNDGMDENILVVAEKQSAGRGRQGKSFYSPAETGIYMSLVTHPMLPLQSAVSATTAAAVAVCRAIERLTDLKPEIKWVNDVYLNDRKICGILTEAVTDFESGTATSVIVGIGVNISTADFPPEVDNATSLGCDVKRAELICTIANELNRINVGSYSDFIDYYRAHSMIIGENISIIQNGETVNAKALAIDDCGGLEVEFADGSRTTLVSGEITIRKR